MFKNCVFRADVDTIKWARAAVRRAAKTMAQTAVAMLPAAVTITAVDWKTVIGTAALAGVASILTSLQACRNWTRYPDQRRSCHLPAAGSERREPN